MTVTIRMSGEVELWRPGNLMVSMPNSDWVNRIYFLRECWSMNKVAITFRAAKRAQNEKADRMAVS
jgi:hypothetical protein